MFFRAQAALVILLLCFFTLTTSNATQVSQAQIEQFKKLPKAQQKLLASTLGIDLQSVQSQFMQGTDVQDGPEEITQYQPRKSVSDNTKAHEDDFEHVAQLKPFGYDVFANTPQTFTPTMDIAIPADYSIAPGDKIAVQVFGKENYSFTLEVNRQGQVVFPQYGPFKVANLLFSEMKQLITAKIKEKIIGVNVAISMASLRSMRVFVLGDVYQPGSYHLSALSSITHAIFAAGGVSDIGSLRNIQLKRAGKLINTLDLYDLLIKGDSSNDVLLQSGDVVFIAPVGQTVSISGEVRRAAIYELLQGETFADVATMAGGLLPSAFAKSTIVERYNSNNLRSVLNIDFTNNRQRLTKVQAGDVINVLKAADSFSQSVTLIGAITRPGKYQWQSGQKVADLLPKVSSHLLANADLHYSLIIREIDVARNIDVLQFELAKAIADPLSQDNITLHANDKVLIFSQLAQITNSSEQLDTLAYTQEVLGKKEQQKAKDKFITEQFWQKYGRLTVLPTLAENEKAKFINRSIMSLSGANVDQQTSIEQLAIFSRQRLLLPVIQKLKRQGRAGQPIQLVEIDGSVKFPGVYPLAVNARVSDLVLAAGGVSESAYLARADITRNKIDPNLVSKHSLSLNLSAALQGDEVENRVLQSRDRLNVHQIPAWGENHVVELKGEFVFPGKYTIRRGESLSHVIAKAGGFTRFAHQDGSVFTRIKLQELERQNLVKLAGDLQIEIASKSLSDDSYSKSYVEVKNMLNDLTSLQPVGRLVLDLPRVVADNNYDVLLEDGDVLYVPTLKNSVNVIGQVQVTSSHIFDEGLTVEDYLRQSGGSKKRADEDRIYIISANGSIKMVDNDHWFTTNAGSNMKPGDTVVVPLDSEYMNNLTLWTSATTIMYNTAVALAAISGI